MIRLNYCIKLDTPEEVTKKVCDCYQKTLFFLYNFRYYQVECCRGWYNYMFPRKELAWILNKALEFDGVKDPQIQDGCGYARRGSLYFYENCSQKPEKTINAIPILRIIENTYDYMHGYWDSYDAITRDPVFRNQRYDISNLHSWNKYQLEQLIQPGFIKKDISKQLEILVKQLRKEIKNVRSQNDQ